MSLADELLADLEDAGDLEEDQLYQHDARIQEVEDLIPLGVDTKSKSIRAIAKLRDSEEVSRCPGYLFVFLAVLLTEKY